MYVDGWLKRRRTAIGLTVLCVVIYIRIHLMREFFENVAILLVFL